MPAGAIAYQRDLPNAEIHLLDAGHFTPETGNAPLWILADPSWQIDAAGGGHINKAVTQAKRTDPVSLVRAAKRRYSTALAACRITSATSSGLVIGSI